VTISVFSIFYVFIGFGLIIKIRDLGFEEPLEFVMIS